MLRSKLPSIEIIMRNPGWRLVSVKVQYHTTTFDGLNQWKFNLEGKSLKPWCLESIWIKSSTLRNIIMVVCRKGVCSNSIFGPGCPHWIWKKSVWLLRNLTWLSENDQRSSTKTIQVLRHLKGIFTLYPIKEQFLNISWITAEYIICTLLTPQFP